MEVLGKIKEAREEFGTLFVTFEINSKGTDLGDELKDLTECPNLLIKATKFKEKRSLNANAYLWVLLSKMANKLRSTKDTLYLLQLSKYGVFTDVIIQRDAYEMLKSHFRYTEILREYDDSMEVRCYYGSSSYTTEEMSYLLDMTVEDAKALGIDVATPDEIARMESAWRNAHGDINY